MIGNDLTQQKHVTSHLEYAGYCVHMHTNSAAGQDFQHNNMENDLNKYY